MTEQVKRLIDRIDNAAALPDDSPETRLQKTLVIFLSAGGILLVPWGAAYLYGEGLVEPAVVVIGYACLSALSLMHLLITRNVTRGAALQLVGLLLTPAALQWAALRAWFCPRPLR
jgi:hypothetical protein